MSIRRIVPDIAAEDPASTVAFYKGVLGLEVAMDMGWIITFCSASNRTAQINIVKPSTDVATPDQIANVMCHIGRA